MKRGPVGRCDSLQSSGRARCCNIHPPPTDPHSPGQIQSRSESKPFLYISIPHTCPQTYQIQR